MDINRSLTKEEKKYTRELEEFLGWHDKRYDPLDNLRHQMIDEMNKRYSLIGGKNER